MQIGELAQRIGVTTDVLRVWERRHHLFSPTRSGGGYRLYSAADERRARRVLALRQRGIPLPEAVARVLGDAGANTPSSGDLLRPSTPAGFLDRLDAAVLTFDAVALNTALDEAVDLLGVTTGLGEVAMGYLHRLGDQWSDGTVGIAHEHFASHLIRRRINDLLRLHPADGRPTVVLACPPGERHDIGLLAFGVLLSHNGWCVRFLGADTPLSSLALACEALDPSLVILSATRQSAFLGRAGAIRRIAGRWPVAIAGQGAGLDTADDLGATLLPDDIATAPEAAEALVAERRSSLVGAGASGGRP